MSDDKKPLPADAQQSAGQTPAVQQNGTVRQSEDSATGPGPAAAGNGKRPTDDRPLPDDPSESAQNPPSDSPAAAPLEIMPGSAPTTPGETGQALVLVPPAGAPQPPPPPTPIDYAMPSQPKSWLPSPALIKNLGCIFKMLFGFTFLLGVGYFMLMAMNPKARQWALQGSQPGPADATGAGGGSGGGRGPTPFKAVNQILALPAQALGKTDDVVQANNARVGLLNNAIAEEEGMAAQGASGGASRSVINPFVSAPAAKGAGGPAAPGAGGAPGGSAELSADEQRAATAARMLALQEKISSMPADGSGGTSPSGPADRVTATAVKDAEVLAPVTLAGGIVIAGASPEGAPTPTRGFFYWVVRLNITGVFQNDPPRILLNGRLAYERQEVNIPLGIVFERLDPAQKLLFFRDKTGAIVTRSY